jgi:hypothetical protein
MPSRKPRLGQSAGIAMSYARSTECPSAMSATRKADPASRARNGAANVGDADAPAHPDSVHRLQNVTELLVTARALIAGCRLPLLCGAKVTAVAPRCPAPRRRLGLDTRNDLPSFGLWRELLDRVRAHLAVGGIFACDVNTTGRPRRLWQGPALAHDFGLHVVIMDVTTAGGDLSAWRVRISIGWKRPAPAAPGCHPRAWCPAGPDQGGLALGVDIQEETALYGGEVSGESDRAFSAYLHRR